MCLCYESICSIVMLNFFLAMGSRSRRRALGVACTLGSQLKEKSLGERGGLTGVNGAVHKIDGGRGKTVHPGQKRVVEFVNLSNELK